MEVIILGSGTSTGVPMVGCRCRVCSSSDPRDKRTRASLLVQWNERYVLVDACTDLRRQVLREQVPQVDAVLLTHSHADHIHGIDDLRGFHFIHRRVIPCFASPNTMEKVSGIFSYIFEGMSSEGYSPLMTPVTVTGPFELFGRT